MESHLTGSEDAPEQPRQTTHLQPVHHELHPHHVRPIDPGYRLVVRITLWVIAGTVLLGFCIWWMAT